MPGNLTLFQTKETQFCYPVQDKMVHMDTLGRSLPSNLNGVSDMQRDPSGTSNSAPRFIMIHYMTSRLIEGSFCCHNPKQNSAQHELENTLPKRVILDERT